MNYPWFFWYISVTIKEYYNTLVEAKKITLDTIIVDANIDKACTNSIKMYIYVYQSNKNGMLEEITRKNEGIAFHVSASYVFYKSYTKKEQSYKLKNTIVGSLAQLFTAHLSKIELFINIAWVLQKANAFMASLHFVVLLSL